MNRPDPLADAVRAAWEAHAATLSTRDIMAMERAFLVVLIAERALAVDCLASCTQPGARASYEAEIASYDAQIDDSQRRIR